MEISEAIEILKNYREELWKDNSRVEEWAESGEDLEKMYAIETVLRELEGACKFIDEEEETIVEKNNKICELEYKVDNSISKDKIKEKIEELKAVTETCYGRIKYQEGKIAGLEELLKGE